ncbi:deoxyribonuclease II isoform X2 [Rhynchophorus ferrugineus]|uniref:deoxyribonuclease II isoform X2 n=1 Tax=Rhynchophorus ferrugineus TaxID=354439 RepID=UPI003FCCD755
MLLFNKIITFTLLLVLSTSSCYSFQCMDQENQPVDWFLIYKFPKQPSHPNKLIRKGLGFVYITSNNVSNWILSNVGITDPNNLVSNTLAPIYNTSLNDLLYIFYNDQPPYGKTPKKKGHTKGGLLTDNTNGFWLVHSVPHFPFFLDKYRYPGTGIRNGQSFLCLSLNITNLNTVGIQLQYNQPHIFAANASNYFQTSTPELYKAANNITVGQAPWYNIAFIITLAGTNLTSFAKSRQFGKDLYSDLVAPSLEANLDVETWPNEPDRLASECDKPFKVANILNVTFTDIQVTFNTTVDHSKWAVSTQNNEDNWICIGDINRAKPQTLRGGGTTCLHNSILSTLYQNIIVNTEPCQKINNLYHNL